MSNKRYICIATGGTSGHIKPAMLLANQLEKNNIKVFFITTKRNFYPDLLSSTIKYHFIRSKSVKDKKGYGILKSVFLIVLETITQASFFLKNRPQIIVGFGGYGSISTYLAALLLGIKIVIHESNIRSGSSNRIVAPLAKKILCDSASCDLYSKNRKKSIVVGTPIISYKDEEEKKKHINNFTRKYHLNKTYKYLLVFGGSQGSKTLNDFIANNKNLILKQYPNLSIIHILGSNFKDTKTTSSERYLVFNYLTDMRGVFGLARFSLNRSGAGTCAELIEYELPAIYVPYPYGNMEQYHNAKKITEVGGGYLIEDTEVNSSPDSVLLIMEKFLQNDNVLISMKTRLQKMKSKTNSINLILEELEKIL